jgi:hypothetical protein
LYQGTGPGYFKSDIPSMIHPCSRRGPGWPCHDDFEPSQSMLPLLGATIVLRSLHIQPQTTQTAMA